jgi:tape measure domain-containing protein
MSFSAADLVATIQLGGVDTVSRDLDKVRGKLNDTDSVASKLGKTGEAVFRGAATAIGVASVAAAAYVTKLFSTGVAYNQLQQTSRAALRTLMGGAEQANAQMDKLDAFARNSPFSKSTFISAQQQLIGFGFEAQKVIPILDAVQNSVAAVGGSNQQISDIVSILAKIRSSGKLTAEDFNMLGERGLDAATLLGQGFGKSASEIREAVTKGTLDAGEAVDVLVAQMNTKFAGAASNVKETFAGTKDRIAAASRDIGAALAEPFVSKNGGGLAVTWGNQVADVMRAVEKHTAPVVSMLVARAMPAFAGLTETLDQARVQVKAWDSSRLERGLDSMANHAPGLAALAGAVLGVNSQLLASIPVVGRFVPAFGPLGGAIAAAALASPELRAELGRLLGELKPLIPVGTQLASTLSGTLSVSLPIVATGIRAVTSVAAPLADVISKIPAPMLATAAAGIAVFTALRSGAPAIQSFVDGVRRIGEQAAVQAALAGMEGNTSRMAGTFGVAGAAATGLGNSLKAAFISNPVGLIILGVSTAAAILTATLTAQGAAAQKTKDRIQAYRETLTDAGETTKATTDKIREAIDGFSDIDIDLFTSGGDQRAKEWIDKIGGAEKAMLRFGETSGTVTDAIRDGGTAYDTLLASLDKYTSKTESVTSTTGLKERMTSEAEAANLLRDSIVEQREAIETASRIQAEYNQRMQAAAAAMTDAERSNGRLNEALTIARDVTRDATERLSALKQALDELNGGTKTQAELTRDLNEQALNLADAFAQTDENGNKLAASLVNSAGGIDTTTRAGVTLHDQVSRLNDEMLTAITQAVDFAKKNGDTAGAMQAGTQAAQPYIDKLRQIASDAGLSQEQVNGLVGSMLDTPAVVSFIMSDDGTIDLKKQELIEFVQSILATPNGEFIVDDASTIAGIQRQLEIMGFKITTLPDGRVKVSASGVETVENALNRLARDRSATIRVTTSGEVKIGNKTLSPGMATGGPVKGPGTGTSDTAGLFRLSNDEHVFTAREVAAAGGHEGIFRIRQALLNGGIGGLAGMFPGRADGGPIYPIRDFGDSLLNVAGPSPSQSSSTGALGDPRIVALLELIAANLGRPNVTFQNPVSRDAVSDAWEAAQIVGVDV